MNRTVLKMLMVAATGLVAVSCFNKKPSERSAGSQLEAVADNKVHPVKVVEATMQDVKQQSTYSATVEAYAVNNIAPQSASRIQKIRAEVGDYVHKGQVVAEMDRLQLDQTRLQLLNDSTEFDRLKKLYEKGGIAKSDLDAVELAYKVRRATYDNLKTNTILRSPITGFITARNYDKGDLYAMAQPLFVVQQVVPVKLKVGISESEYTRVRKGDKVQIVSDALAGRTFEGRVNRLYPTVDAMTHTFIAEVIVNNNDRALRPGMYTKVTVTFGTNHSVVIPDRAVVKQEGSGQRFVYILNPDNTVSFTPVKLGRHIGGDYEILEGVPEGASVVVKGTSGLREGSKVELIDE
ncbi:MAG: efflux RND transporter periplasmic adaptor subunit [Bacteroidales bacterium]|jgi:RND family efflux transporter MFP subunit|nr:efflux RND transporter periplasmic adaptor subunit [Bacteroidales bacterium]